MSDYPVWAVKNARELREAGESLRAIAQAVYEDTGRRPSQDTINRWTNPRAAQADRQHTARVRARTRAERHAGNARLGRSIHSAEFKFARIVALRDEGVSVAAIARVMSFDFEPITRAQVEHALQVGHYPRRLS